MMLDKMLSMGKPAGTGAIRSSVDRGACYALCDGLLDGSDPRCREVNAGRSLISGIAVAIHEHREL